MGIVTPEQPLEKIYIPFVSFAAIMQSSVKTERRWRQIVWINCLTEEREMIERRLLSTVSIMDA